ncbi:MAG: ECF transporter S component [Lachnospiraceae bacterium]|nr:ECF transporter S component [Lachnospiraceae bacterium]
MSKNRSLVRSMAFIAIAGALGAVLMALDFAVPFVPSFLKFDISDLPGLFVGFFLGPVQGAACCFVKVLVRLLIKPTKTGYIGELVNLLGSLAFILPASLIYRRLHTKKGALISLISATLFVSVAYIFLNAYISFPMYGKLYHLSTDAIVAMGSAVNPLVKDNVTLMLFSIFPFNLFKYGVASLLTWLLYKRCGRVLRSIMAEPDKS